MKQGGVHARSSNQRGLNLWVGGAGCQRLVSSGCPELFSEDGYGINEHCGVLWGAHPSLAHLY
eukprot:1161090-Pelagomonas_calceolata.AAC.3